MADARPTAVLVHGAFADASGWAPIIRILTGAGYPVVAPPNQLRGVAHDAGQVRDVVATVGGPVVLVGHSYGGAVITQAAEGLKNLTGLVYLAAFAPDVGESVASLQAGFPAPLLATTAQPTPYDAVGADGGPELYIQQDRFRETFAGDSPEDLAAVMAVSQRPLAAAATQEELTYAGWAHLPTWYLVSGADRAIAPELERSVAKRMGAVTEEIADGSHTAFIAHADVAAAFIRRALDA